MCERGESGEAIPGKIRQAFSNHGSYPPGVWGAGGGGREAKGPVPTLSCLPGQCKGRQHFLRGGGAGHHGSQTNTIT